MTDPSGASRRRIAWTPIIALVLWALCVGWYQLVQNDDPGLSTVATLIATTLLVIVLVVWFGVLSGYSRGVRVAPVVGIAAALAVFFSLFRLEFRGAMGLWPIFRWASRDLPTPGGEPPPGDDALPRSALSPAAQDFPQFLGPTRSGRVEGIRLERDWKAHPPRTLWRQPIGDGWSGFVVVGRRAVTQEQRDDEEWVTCYDLLTGRLLWRHADRARFDDLGGFLGGVGPRATPTIHEGKVYALGATGILNCLRLIDGARLWSKDVLADNDAQNVNWGKSGSPLVLDERVIVSAGGTDERSLVAYHKDTGGRVWAGGTRVSAYSSPSIAVLGGVRQVLIVNEDFITAHDAATGRVLWEYPWPGKSNQKASASQAVDVGGDRVLVSKGYGGGSALLKVTRGADGRWTTEPVWANTRLLKTKFSNIVLRDGYAYGLDETILQCVRLDTGRQAWKHSAARYDYGQLLLVDDVILVMTETDGDIVMVEATPEGFHELARHPVLEGKTWNNPALAGPYLVVRNAREAACYELPLRPR